MAKQDQIEEYRFDNRTPEEQREIARQGGIASGKSRKEKATMKKVLEEMLEEVADIDGNEKKLTYKQLATLGLIKGAIQGNHANYRTIMESIGELEEPVNTTPKIEIEIIDNEHLEKTLYKKED